MRGLPTGAAEPGLGGDRRALTTLATAIATFGAQAENGLEERGSLAAARQALESLSTQAGRSAGNAGQREQEAAHAQARGDELAAKLAAVEGTIGVGYREIPARLAQLRGCPGKLREKTRHGPPPGPALAKR